MVKLNKYTIDKAKEFHLTLGDDNNVIEVDIHKTEGYPRLEKMTLYIIEDDLDEKHINKFKFIKAGDNIGYEHRWMYICRVGDEFLFQKSSWEG